MSIESVEAEPIDPAVERMARMIVANAKADPEMLVQPGTPQVFGVPGGGAFSVSPGTEVPLWTFYIASARSMLAMAREVDYPAHQSVVPLPPIQAPAA